MASRGVAGGRAPDVFPCGPASQFVRVCLGSFPCNLPQRSPFVVHSDAGPLDVETCRTLCSPDTLDVEDCERAPEVASTAVRCRPPMLFGQ